MHILYVEDDPVMRRHVLHELTRCHDVVEACSGAEACWLLNYHGTDLDVVITDINLGSELDGWTVAQHARDLSHDIAVIYATGGELDRELLPKSVALAKPFSASALEHAIARASYQAAH